MTIKVTVDDIKEGKPSNPCFCPIALACRRHGLKSVFVRPDTVKYSWDKEDFGDSVALLPNEAMIFVGLFDRKQTVEPFSFELETKPCARLSF